MNCKWLEVVLALIVIVFAVWQSMYSQWVIVIAAAIILLHALMCKSCHVGHGMHMRKK